MEAFAQSQTQTQTQTQEEESLTQTQTQTRLPIRLKESDVQVALAALLARGRIKEVSPETRQGYKKAYVISSLPQPQFTTTHSSEARPEVVDLTASSSSSSSASAAAFEGTGQWASRLSVFYFTKLHFDLFHAVYVRITTTLILCVISHHITSNHITDTNPSATAVTNANSLSLFLDSNDSRRAFHTPKYPHRPPIGLWLRQSEREGCRGGSQGLSRKRPTS
jgi:hypothetical protein